MFKYIGYGDSEVISSFRSGRPSWSSHMSVYINEVCNRFYELNFVQYHTFLGGAEVAQ
jgi:hypothetical protein